MTDQIARPVWATELPWVIGNTMESQVDALETLFGQGISLSQHNTHMVAFTPGKKCECLRCDHDIERVIQASTRTDPNPGWWSRFYACQDCHDKRCPKAQDHNIPCQKDPIMRSLEGQTK